MTRQQVYDIALKASLALDYSPESNIKKIFFNLGGVVLEENSPNYLEIFKEGKFVVNCKWSMDRFAYAKAICHYILHSNMGNPLTIKMGVVDRMEVEGKIIDKNQLTEQLQGEYPGAIVHNVYPIEENSVKIKNAQRYQPEKLTWGE